MKDIKIVSTKCVISLYTLKLPQRKVETLTLESQVASRPKGDETWFIKRELYHDCKIKTVRSLIPQEDRRVIVS